MNRESGSQNKYLLNIVALCAVLLVFTPIGIYLQISAIEIYDVLPLGILGRSRLIRYTITYLPALTYIVSLGAAIMGFRVNTNEERKGTAITSLIAGGALIVFGGLMLILPYSPLVIFLIAVAIGLFFFIKNKISG